MSEAGLLQRSDGLHEGVSHEEYHARVLGVVNKGALEEVERSAQHYRAWVGASTSKEITPAFAFGGAFHCAVLEPDRFGTAYAVEPAFGDCRKTENKKRRDDWRAEHTGAIILSADDELAIRGMARALRDHPMASKLLQGGDSELTALWHDAETGLRCKVRADYYKRSNKVVVDLKSTQDASPEAFARDAFRYRYHWSHSLYREGFAALGEEAAHFIFIAVEKEPPYGIGVYSLDSEGVSLAYQKTRSLINKLATCVRSDEWPGYCTGIQTIVTPKWAA